MNSSHIFIGIGAQKAATSWLYKCLEEHPEACVADGKETHYFSTNYSNGEEWYRNKFSECLRDCGVLVDVSTSYLSSEEAPARIKQDIPHAKLFVCLRDPVARALSLIGHYHAKGKIVDGTSLEDIVAQFPTVLENGFYGKHLARYLQYFNLEEIHVIKFSDIQSNPHDVVKRLYNFVGVDDSFVPKIINQRYNSGTERHSWFFKKLNRYRLRYKNNTLVKILIACIKATGLRTRHIVGIIDRQKYTSQYQISKEERKWLHDLYIDDQEKLHKILQG